MKNKEQNSSGEVKKVLITIMPENRETGQEIIDCGSAYYFLENGIMKLDVSKLISKQKYFQPKE
jgi:hypothetical protein